MTSFMRYVACFYQDENSDIGVCFHDFPGCVTAGETNSEAQMEAQSALQFHVDGIQEDETELPKPSTIGFVLATYKETDGFLFARTVEVVVR